MDFNSKILQQSKEVAKKFGNPYICLEHILYVLLEDKDIEEMLTHFNMNAGALKKKCIKSFEEMTEVLMDSGIDEMFPDGYIDVIKLDEYAHDFFRKVMAWLQQSESEESNSFILFYIMLKEDGNVHVAPRILHDAMKASGTSFNSLAKYIAHGPSFDKEAHISDYVGTQKEKKNELPSFLVNLNEKAKNGKISSITGRDEEIARSIQILLRHRKNNPILVGEPGVGKTAIVEGIAAKIVNKDIQNKLKDKVIMEIDLAMLMAGTKYRGEFEQKVQYIFEFAKKNPHVIFFMDEIHTVVGAGATGSGSLDFSNMLKPKLANGEITLIGATTFDEYKDIQKDAALLRRLQMVEVKEPSVEDAIVILKKVAEKLQVHHHVKYGAGMVEKAVKLSVRHMHNKFLPDKAIDVLDEAGSYASLHGLENVDDKVIDKVISRMAMIPETNLTENDRERIQNLDFNLKMSVYGQDKQIESITDLIALAKNGLSDPSKPMASLFFSGPTGVGKTELAVQLAKNLNMHFERFDMSNYKDPGSIKQLVGASPQFVGYEEGGQLTNALMKHPYSVILFDEIEKAHKDVWDFFLPMMDHGMLVDGQGKKVSCKNTIIIFTSNIGQTEIQKVSIGLGGSPIEKAEKKPNKVFEMIFSPEFRNRLDGVIEFNHLDKENIYKIIDKNVLKIEKMLLEKGNAMNLKLTEDAKQYILSKGYDHKLGAREMDRAIKQTLTIPLSRFLMKSNIKDDSVMNVIHVKLENDHLVFSFQKEVTKKSKKMTMETL